MNREREAVGRERTVQSAHGPLPLPWAASAAGARAELAQRSAAPAGARAELAQEAAAGAAVTLYVGGQGSMVQGEPMALGGARMFSAAGDLPRAPEGPASCYLDSGAFSDPPARRLSVDEALARQLSFERRVSGKWGRPFQAAAVVSYDLLIDETWVAGARYKRRWSVRAAERAVRLTVDAARYLVSQRPRLGPRSLILACQGVDALQQEECAIEILRMATRADIVGLGGWCILGRARRLLPIFYQTIHRLLPRVAAAGVRQVHIFGVLLLQALGPLVWLADRYGLRVSTDSSAPVLACTWPNPKRAGVRCAHWRDNVRYWRHALARLRMSPHYRCPPDGPAARQLAFDWGAQREGADQHAARC